MRAKKNRDFFSKGIIIYAALFFLTYRTLLQLSYNDKLSWHDCWRYALIVIHIIGLLWCLGACLLCLMPRQFGSFVCAAALVIGLELLSPDPMLLHFWFKKSDYLAHASTLQSLREDRLSIVFFSHATYREPAPCSTEIVFDNISSIRELSNSGRIRVEKVGDNFYFRYPPCG